jgi:hypothetical protein
MSNPFVEAISKNQAVKRLMDCRNGNVSTPGE